ncbi:MAG: hypothetical protein JWP12_3847 [Bacteroidetes bacterium]|nr:hypothetical protein [Bacteroidota bacterium]
MLCVLVLHECNLFAQSRKTDTINYTTEGSGTYYAHIADANKINNNPEVKDSTQKIAVGPYGIHSQRINTPYAIDPIIPAQMVGEPLTKLYSGLVKVGYGNYNMPYGEVWYNNLRSKEYAYGIHMKHLSSTSTLKDYGNSSFSDNELGLYGKKFLKEHTLLGNFDYNRNVVHFYGYDPVLHRLEKDETVQRFNLFTAGAELQSHYTKPERFNHDIRLSYYNLMDLYKSSENNINANGFVQTAIQGELLKVNAGVDYYNYKTKTDTTNNTIITLNPNFIATGEKYRASIGITAAVDVQPSSSKFYFYPNVELSYNIFEDIIIPYAGVTGGLKKNSFKSLTDENPFVLSALQTKNSNTKYELFGGLRGTLSSKIAYTTRVSYASVNNMALYVNDYEQLLQNRFGVIYDNAEVLNVRGEVSYQAREKLRINIRGDYFNYKMENEIRAWFKPQVKFTLSGNYNLKDKIVVKADLFYIDSQYAKIITEDAFGKQTITAKELKGVFDANIGVEYRYTKKLGFFVNLNNIAAQRYNRWYKYPTQKFGFMAGLSYSF